jgi:hypothetical protein
MNLYRQALQNKHGGGIGDRFVVADSAKSARQALKEKMAEYERFRGPCVLEVKGILVAAMGAK